MPPPEERTFEPIDWQVDPWGDTSPVMLLTGSAGGGKSRIAGEKIHAFCMRYPGATGLILRKTRESLVNSTVIFMERKIVGNNGIVKHKQGKRRFEYANGSILAYGGMKDDDQRESIRSIGQDSGIDIVWMEEGVLFTEADYNEVTARMRGKAAPWTQIILSTNPDIPIHWINRRLIKQGEAVAYYSGAQNNPHNPPEYIDALNRLTGVQRDRLCHGKWVQAEGVVYEEFSEAIHVIDAFEIPKEWRRVRVIDFGYTNPFVCQWWAMDNDGRAYMYREIYHTQRIVEDHARMIRGMEEEERIEATICDHDAEGRATLERHLRCKTTSAQKSIAQGIQRVRNRLKVAGDGKPRIFFLKNALVMYDDSLAREGRPTCTIDEFAGYQWPKGVDGKALKEVPIDRDNHGMDCVRYLTGYLDPVKAKFKRALVRT